MPKEILLAHTPNPEHTIASAAKLCYSSARVEDLVESLTDEKAASFVEMLSEIGHESPIEHASFTFGIEGVSRALLAQITRHRMASFSVKSQRYVREGSFEYVTPPEVELEAEALKIYITLPEYTDVDCDVFDGLINLPLLPKISLEETEKWIAEYEGKDTWPLAKRRLVYYKDVKKAILSGESDKEYRPIPQSLVKIGNVVFASCPYELFSEINLRFQKEVKDYNVIVLSNANGIGGYFPTESELCRLGYEILMFLIDDIQCYTNDVDYHFMKETIKNIENIK